MSNATVPISYPCPQCGSTRAAAPLKSDRTSVVRCFDCHEELGSLEDIQREITEKAREEATARAKEIYHIARRVAGSSK